MRTCIMAWTPGNFRRLLLLSSCTPHTTYTHSVITTGHHRLYLLAAGLGQDTQPWLTVHHDHCQFALLSLHGCLLLPPLLPPSAAAIGRCCAHCCHYCKAPWDCSVGSKACPRPHASQPSSLGPKNAAAAAAIADPLLLPLLAPLLPPLQSSMGLFRRQRGMPAPPRFTAFVFGPQNYDWAAFTVFLLASDGGVYALCPVAPFGMRARATMLRQLPGVNERGTVHTWLLVSEGACGAGGVCVWGGGDVGPRNRGWGAMNVSLASL